MELADFKLRSLSFELRYEPAYQIYDLSGEIWTAAKEKWGELKVMEAVPNLSRFIINKTVQVSVQLEMCSVVWADTKIESKVFIEHCEFLTNLVKSKLEVRNFKRIGCRQIFIRPYSGEGMAQAAADFISTKRLGIPSGKNFGVDGIMKGGEYSIKMEGEALGWLGRVLIQNKKLIFDPPPGEDEIPHIDVDRTELAYDFDYYTTAHTLAGQLRPKDWIEQALHVVRRDSGVLLGTTK